MYVRNLRSGEDLRDDVQIEGCEYVMIGKGHRTKETLGGATALLYKKKKRTESRGNRCGEM
ncbi:hypothetical protein E2C01_068297 [Portunus trituberculatus]|uniref:Uncharacterized protein n=1 Tax=Portunus trituberculatus TaxID=210409 RepID=A0A5B7HZN4_PORTR|nr:hypothetical protein [Portunus trituberculatus]